MLIAPIPLAKRDWALPFCSELTPSERYYQDRNPRRCKLTDRARQMLLMVRRWLPERRIVVVADSSFAAIELLATVCAQVCVITRLRLDAALYDPVPPRRLAAMGRPRLKGARQPTLAMVLADASACWQAVTVAKWYGEGERTVEVATSTALWYHSGMLPVALRWVLVRDRQCRFKPQAFLYTDQTVMPGQILEWFVKRWQVGVTFKQARAHLGMETQREWSSRAIARTTPAILALYSIVTLMAASLLEHQTIITQDAAWYEKDTATFSDTMALMRRWLWSQQTLAMSKHLPDTIKIPLALFERLTETLSYAS